MSSLRPSAQPHFSHRCNQHHFNNLSHLCSQSPITVPGISYITVLFTMPMSHITVPNTDIIVPISHITMSHVSYNCAKNVTSLISRCPMPHINVPNTLHNSSHLSYHYAQCLISLNPIPLIIDPISHTIVLDLQDSLLQLLWQALKEPMLSQALEESHSHNLTHHIIIIIIIPHITSHKPVSHLFTVPL